MPKTSDREKLLTDLEETMKLAKFDEVLRDEDDDEDFLETSYGMVSTLHFLISQQHFLSSRRQILKSRDYIYNYFLDQPDDEFRKITRVTRATFNHILELIQTDDIFQNQSCNPQAPLHWQLACALDRLGNDGQGVSHARSKLIWGIGQGTVHLYTRRVVKALFNLNRQFIRWPSHQERDRISRRMAAKGFKDCVGFVDGTTIPLHKKPAIGGNVYMDRKKNYSVNAQIVCDDCNNIIYFKTGQPGSVGDSRAFNRTELAKTPERAFSPGQYLLSDSAYGATEYVVPAYKENQRDNRSDQHEPRKIERFNTFLAKARVVNEHTIGILKARWTSLRGMRVDIHQPDDMWTFIWQVVACVVLHNICLMRDPWDDEVSEEGDDNKQAVNDDAPVQRRRPLTLGQRKRWQVRNACLAFHDMVTPGQYLLYL